MKEENRFKKQIVYFSGRRGGKTIAAGEHNSPEYKRFGNACHKLNWRALHEATTPKDKRIARRGLRALALHYARNVESEFVGMHMFRSLMRDARFL
jgi:hypothetical protein